MKNVKKNAIGFELFWYKVFVHKKLKLLFFLVDSVLISSPVGEKEIKRVMVVEREVSGGGGGRGVEGFQIASPAFCLLCRASFFNFALRVIFTWTGRGIKIQISLG